MSRRQLKRMAHDAEHLRLLLAWRNAPKGLKAVRAQAVTDYITGRLKNGG